MVIVYFMRSSGQMCKFRDRAFIIYAFHFLSCAIDDHLVVIINR